MAIPARPNMSSGGQIRGILSKLAPGTLVVGAGLFLAARDAHNCNQPTVGVKGAIRRRVKTPTRSGNRRAIGASRRVERIWHQTDSKRLIEQLDRLRRQLLTLDGHNPDDPTRYQLFPSAPAEALARVEEYFGAELPGSYRDFLRNHHTAGKDSGRAGASSAYRPTRIKHYMLKSQRNSGTCPMSQTLRHSRT
jgi:hypothetical protein